MGHTVKIISPQDFKNVSLFFYKEIKLSLFPYRKLSKMLDNYNADAIHIPVEGPLGWAARRYCRKRGLPFTTAFHTNFADYAAKRTPSPIAPFIRRFFMDIQRRFHAPAKAMFVATRSLEDELRANQFHNIMVLLTRGVNTDIFYPPAKSYQDPKPKLLYVGRVAIEKNIEAFLNLDMDCEKIVVGNGPDLEKLKAKYPNAFFTGLLEGENLADQYRQADCFVFPSKTDTFGIVIIEALACGLPVAAYNVTGPKDIITDGRFGCCDENLQTAINKAMQSRGNTTIRHDHIVKNYTWPAVAKAFINVYSHSNYDTGELRHAA